MDICATTSQKSSPEKAVPIRKRHLMLLVLHRTICKRHLLPNQPERLVVSLPRTIAVELLADRDLWQADILHDGPDDGQTTGFRRKGVNLSVRPRTLLNKLRVRVGAPDVAVHDWRESIKRQEMLFIFEQATHRLGIALLVFGECSPPD